MITYPFELSVTPEKDCECWLVTRLLDILCFIFHWSCSLSLNSWLFSRDWSLIDSSSFSNSASRRLSLPRWERRVEKVDGVILLDVFPHLYFQQLPEILHLTRQVVYFGLRLVGRDDGQWHFLLLSPQTPKLLIFQFHNRPQAFNLVLQFLGKTQKMYNLQNSNFEPGKSAYLNIKWQYMTIWQNETII